VGGNGGVFEGLRARRVDSDAQTVIVTSAPGSSRRISIRFGHEAIVGSISHGRRSKLTPVPRNPAAFLVGYWDRADGIAVGSISRVFLQS